MLLPNSLSMLFLATAPALVLMAIGLFWFFWWKPVKEIPITLFSIGLTLFALVLVVITTNALRYGYSDSVGLILGFSLLIYAATLTGFARCARLSPPKMIFCGVVGLVPLYYLSGFTLIYSACSFNSGGC